MAVTPYLELFLPDGATLVADFVDGTAEAMTKLDDWAQAHASGGGGGGALPDSWIVAFAVGFSDGVGGPAPGEHFDWSNDFGQPGNFPVVVGDDLRVNPLDSTEIEVLTEGDYVICVDVTYRTDEDPTEGVVMLSLEGTFYDSGWGLAANDMQAVRVASFGQQLNYPWTTPPVHMAAGTTIRVRYSPNIVTGAVTALYGEITVKRTGGSDGGGGGGGSYTAPSTTTRTITVATPLDGDGNVPIEATDGLVFVDATGGVGGMGLSFPDGLPAGTVFLVVRLDDTPNNQVYFSTPGSSSALISGGLLKRGQQHAVTFDGTNWAVDGITVLTDIGDVSPAGYNYFAGRPSVLGRDPSTGDWTTVTIPGRFVVGFPFTDNYGPAEPGLIVLMDATAGPLGVSLKNVPDAVTTVKKVDDSANPVTVQSEGGVDFGQIEGADTYDITAQGAVTFARGQDGRWWTI